MNLNISNVLMLQSRRTASLVCDMLSEKHTEDVSKEVCTKKYNNFITLKKLNCYHKTTETDCTNVSNKSFSCGGIFKPIRKLFKLFLYFKITFSLYRASFLHKSHLFHNFS